MEAANPILQRMQERARTEAQRLCQRSALVPGCPGVAVLRTCYVPLPSGPGEQTLQRCGMRLDTRPN